MADSKGTKKPSKTGDKHQAAVTLGHYGGKVGGPARAQQLSAASRKRIGRKGARARWGGK